MKSIFIPKDGASDTSVTITEICFENGEEVRVGDVLMVYETSKASYEIDAEEDGFVYFFVHENAKVDIGSKVLTISDKKLQGEELNNHTVKTEIKPANSGNKTISKKAQELINSHGVDVSEIEEELITEEVVKKFIRKANFTYDKSYRFTKNDIVIFGGGGHSGMCYDILKSDNRYSIAGFIDDHSDLFKPNKDLTYFGTLDNVSELKERGLENIIIGVGFFTDLKKREAVYASLKKEFHIPTITHQSAIIETSATIADGCQIMAGAIVGSNVVVKENCIINSGSIISHDSIIGSSTHITPGAVIAGHVEIGQRTTIGMSATLYVGLKIGSDVVINNGISVFDNVVSGTLIK